MNGKNVTTTTKVPIQNQKRRNRRRNNRTKVKYVYVDKPLPKNNNKGGKGRRRSKRNNNRSGGASNKGGEMSKHFAQDKELRLLAAGMMNPFNKQSTGMRLKDSSNSVTDTFYVKTNGTGQTNSNGLGWVGCSPALMVANDLDSINYSVSTSGDTMFVDGKQITSGSPFTKSKFFNGIDNSGENAFRIVSVGIRVRNLSTVFQSSGRIYGVQSNPRIVPLNDYSPVDINKIPHKEYPYQNDDWHAVTRHITDPLDYDFQWIIEGSSSSYLAIYEGGDVDSGESLDNPLNLGMFIATNSAQPYEWEIVGHYERKGPNLQNPSIAKPNQQGMATLTYAMGKTRLMDSSIPDHSVPTKSPKGGGGIVDKIFTGLLDSAIAFVL